MLQSTPRSSEGCSQHNSTAKPNRATSLSPLLPLPPLSPNTEIPPSLSRPPAKPPRLSRNDLQTLGSGGNSETPNMVNTGYNSCPQPTTQIQDCLHSGRIRTFESKSHIQRLFGKLHFIIYWIWLERAQKMSSHHRYLCSPSAA